MNMAPYEVFPDFEDEDLVKILMQIENENKNNENSGDKAQENTLEVQVQQQKGPKTINYSSNIAKIANVNQVPMMTHMYFLHSNVTINYNFQK